MQNSKVASPKEKEYPQKETTRDSKSLSVEYLTLIFGSGLIIFFDQWAKILVLENIPFLGTWLPSNLAQMEPYFRFVHWRNSGAAFGIFQNGNLVFTILAIIASIFIFAYYPLIGHADKYIKLAMIFQLGGAVGNLIDRIKFGYVIDFISLGDFPVFNIADAAISVGVGILLLSVFIQEYQDYRIKNGITNLKITEDSEDRLLREKE